MDVRDIEPRIMSLWVPPESTATYRALNDGGDTYVVRLTLSIGIDGFIEREMWDDPPSGYPREFRLDAHDRMRVEIHDTTLEEVRDRMDELNAWLRNAVGRAAEARRRADLEDDHLAKLAREINESLRESE